MPYLYEEGPTIYESSIKKFFNDKYNKRSTVPGDKSLLDQQRSEFKGLYDNKKKLTTERIENECKQYKELYLDILTKAYRDVDDKLKTQYKTYGFDVPSKSRSRSRSRSSGGKTMKKRTKKN